VTLAKGGYFSQVISLLGSHDFSITKIFGSYQNRVKRMALACYHGYMKAKKVIAPASTISFMVFAPGEEVILSLTEWATANKITAASFSAIGVLNDAEIGYLDRETNDYVRFTVEESAEVLALTGNISVKEGKPEIHAHVVLGLNDTSTRGGHLLSGHAYPTLEMTCTILDTVLERQKDDITDRYLINPA
jgi:predicted DNA-binding protein with PD1-like motif